MKRTKSFDKMLSKKLHNPKFAREYIMASMEGEEAQTLIEAMIEVINVMGHKEFAELVGIERAAISRISKNGDIPKIETLNNLLAPFRLRAKLDVEEVA